MNIPSTVRHVGTYAFNATKIYVNEETDYVYVDSWLVAVKNQELHKTLTKSDLKQGTVGIIDNCFYQAPILEAVQLPDSVRIVGQYAFSGIETLTRFEAGKNLEVLQEGALANCTGLYVLLLNRSLQEIGAYAFYGCSTLDNNALDGNSIIPQSVKRIGAYAFMQTMLWGKPVNNIIYAGNWVVGFAENAKLGAAELKDSVVGIADNAFFQCGTLTSLKNLSKCAYIGTAAFYECTALETVSLNPRLETVEAYTFYKCKSLFRVSVPTMLRSVGRSAFYGCSNLKTLDFSESAVFATIGDFAFYGCSNLETVTFGENLTGLGRYAFKNCSTLTAVELPDTVTAVPEHTFANCSALVTLKLGSGVTSIGNKAFYKCAGLSEVALPDSVRTVGKRVLQVRVPDNADARKFAGADRRLCVLQRQRNRIAGPSRNAEADRKVCVQGTEFAYRAGHSEGGCNGCRKRILRLQQRNLLY
ncbi:MAG: leucine-rich repeat domain-containing protein [Oscillospiraceae bacterium]|nr:MAG: leucine-rich repeat domain-containing protein [Oscillospiraceae bacterium]